MSNSKQNILILWIRANLFAFILLIILVALVINSTFGIAMILMGRPNLDLLITPIIFIAFSIVVSIIPFAQWLMLKRIFTGVGWWIPASVGGVIMGWSFLHITNNIVVNMISATLPIGCMQCLCIDQSFEKKTRWVLASTIGLSSILIIRVYNLNLFTIVIGVAIYILLTGFCLTRWERPNY
jgi:hypothetical protein